MCHGDYCVVFSSDQIHAMTRADNCDIQDFQTIAPRLLGSSGAETGCRNIPRRRKISG